MDLSFGSLEDLLDYLEIPKWQRMNIFWLMERFGLASTQDDKQQISILRLPNGHYCFTITETWVETVVNRDVRGTVIKGLLKVQLEDDDK